MSKPYMCGDDKGIYIPSETGCDCAYTLAQVETDEYEAIYRLLLDGAQVGDEIVIPKDKYIKQGTVKTVTVDDVPYDGARIGDNYLDIALENSDDHVFIPIPSVEGMAYAFDEITFVDHGEPPSSRRFNAEDLGNSFYVHTGNNVSFNYGDNSVTINATSGGSQVEYPVGSVFVTASASVNPTDIFGGSWTLYDAEFEDFYHWSVNNDSQISFTTNYANPNQGDQNVYIQRSGHDLYIKASIMLTGTIADTEAPLFTISQFPGRILQNFTMLFLSDGANGYAYGRITPSGEVAVIDSFSRSGSSVSGTIEAGVVITGAATIPFAFTQTGMLNTMNIGLCNKFYWRRTA